MNIIIVVMNLLEMQLKIYNVKFRFNIFEMAKQEDYSVYE